MFQQKYSRSSRSQMLYKIVVLTNSAEFTRKDLCRYLRYFSVIFFNYFPFLQNSSGRLLLKFVEYLFLESFFVSLDKSILLHRRYLMPKFSKILILVCRKIFFAFSNETFSNSCGLPSSVFSLLTWYFMIGNIFVTDLSNLSH